MALTPDDLAAISKLLEAMEQRLEGKIESATEAVKHELLARIDKSEEEMGELFEKTWKLMDENKKELTERVTTLEEQVHSHKN